MTNQVQFAASVVMKSGKFRKTVPAQVSTSASQNSAKNSGTIIDGSQQSRPLWFNGRFLAATDLQRDQDSFLRRQARLGMAAGCGVIHGLQVIVPPAATADAETFVIAAGQGITPGGYLVMLSSDLTVVLSDLADAEDLSEQFGIASSPIPVARTRSGLFLIALRPVEFSANPIASYPMTVQGTRTTQDGNIVEATAVSLVPFPTPTGNFDASMEQAAVARSIFVAGDAGTASDSLLPLAMVSVKDGVIEWVDQWMVRRDSGPEFTDLLLNLSSPPAHQAYLLQYDAQLQQVVGDLQETAASLSFAATDYFQALPPAGRFPLAAINTTVPIPTQIFFPPQTDVLLALVPDDELPALLEDSASLPPIDLTQTADSYADLAVFALIPVSRQQLAAFGPLAPIALKGALPQVLNNRRPLGLLQYFQGKVAAVPASNAWQTAIGTQTYGYYIRRRSVPVYVSTTTVAITVVAADVAGSYTLTASVSPESVTGTVTFTDVLLGVSSNLGSVTLTQGSGALTVTGLASGVHQLTAMYSGDTYFAASTSATLQQTV